MRDFKRYPLLLALTVLFLVAASTAQEPGAVQNPSAHGPYARIAIMRALDGHGVEWEAGYIRHLEWHRQNKDPFAWYSYSVWASDERQRWIIYATFGHTASELSSPLSPAEDERDNLLNVLPHARFAGNWIYEFLPSISQGSGVPTPLLRAELTTVELKPGTSRAFEDSLSEQKPRLRSETLWYRLVVGGDTPRYIRLRPRPDLAAILDDPDRDLPRGVDDMISRFTVETLNLRPNMLVNVIPKQQ